MAADRSAESSNEAYIEEPSPEEKVKIAEFYYNESFNNMKHGYFEALDLLTQAAKMGHAPSQFKLHELYEEGKVVTKNYKSSFEWLTKAAFNRLEEAYAKLSKYYEMSIFKDVKEAYIWAVIANTTSTYSDSTALIRLEQVIAEPRTILALQKEARRRHEILKARPMTDEDVGSFIPLSVNQGNIQNKSMNVDVTQRTTENSELYAQEDSGISYSKIYKYAKEVSLGFDPGKLKLGLCPNSYLGKSDLADFHYFRISYNYQYIDHIKASEFTADRFTRAQRRLLIRLAVQFYEKDLERRNRNLARLLHDPNLSGHVVSIINRVVYKMFPGCFESNRNAVIDKKAGILNIALSIDKAKFEMAKDFKELWQA